MASKNRNIVIAAAAGVVAVAVVAGWIWDNGRTEVVDEVAARSLVPLYQNLGSLVVNLVDEDEEETHYMQLDIALMTRNKNCAKAMVFYVPVFRNSLLELFSRQTYKQMLVPARREGLRSEARDAILKVAVAKMKTPQIEDVLFTSLVIQ